DCRFVRGPDRVVDAPRFARGRTDRHRAGQVAAVSVQDAAKVQHEKVACREYARTGTVVRHGRMRPGRDDGVEGEALVPRIAHRRLDRACDLTLAGAGMNGCEYGGHDRIETRGRVTEHRDLR